MVRKEPNPPPPRIAIVKMPSPPPMPPERNLPPPTSRFILREIDRDEMFAEGFIAYIDRTPPDTEPGSAAIRPVYQHTYQGWALQQIRKANQWTLREAAKRFGLSATDLSKLERGAIFFRDPTDMIEAISKAFGSSPT